MQFILANTIGYPVSVGEVMEREEGLNPLTLKMIQYAPLFLRLHSHHSSNKMIHFLEGGFKLLKGVILVVVIVLVEQVNVFWSLL